MSAFEHSQMKRERPTERQARMSGKSIYRQCVALLAEVLSGITTFSYIANFHIRIPCLSDRNLPQRKR